MFKFNFKLNYLKIINILPTTLEYNSAVYTSSTYLLLSADFFFNNISVYKFDLQYLIKEVALFLQKSPL